jgi:protein-L-isoaspartate(D-aspartate) O-methyltransferase
MKYYPRIFTRPYLLKISIIVMSVLLSSSLPAKEDAYRKARQNMVERDLKGRDITDKKVLAAMGKVPRHLFVEERLRDEAYADHPLPIDEGQTISQPYIVALMTQILRVKPEDKVLEVGTGSGYQAAVLAELIDKVYSIEIREKLAKEAEETLKKLGYPKVRVKYADGYFGWKEHAPFDAIIITCAANHIPPPLIEQLNEGGKLLLPLGSTTYWQTLTMITKKKGDLIVEQVTDVRFVPMTGEAQKKGGNSLLEKLFKFR